MNRRLLGCLFELAEAAALSVVVFLLVQYFAAQPYQVQQSSMERTLESGEYVLVDKLSPLFQSYQRGDIVVFDPPPSWGADPDTPYVKRVIAVGGDQIDIHDGNVYVNGVKLDESYVFKGDVTAPVDPARHVWTLQPGQLFVMGDHRSVSTDSRAHGPIDQSVVIGRALLRYWPIDKMGILPPAHLPPIPSPAP